MILRALSFASFANLAKSYIHESCTRAGFGGGGILVWVWLFISWVIMGWFRQFRLFFIIEVAFWMRW